MLIFNDMGYEFWIFFAISLLLIIVAIGVKYFEHVIIRNIPFVIFIIIFLLADILSTFWVIWLVAGIIVLYAYEDGTHLNVLIRKIIVYCVKKKTIDEWNLFSDEPITVEKEDELRRDKFILHFANILVTPPNEGRNIILSAGWGDGKTSCINLLKEKIKNIEKDKNEEQILVLNHYSLININPWFNDSKEKMLNAIFGELNDFAKTHFPFKSLEQEFDDISKLSKLKIGYLELSLDSFTKDKNIQNKIKEVGDILKRYKQRLVFCIDDIDRLNKKHILSIIQIVKMFAEYTNVIFILIMNLGKTERILCESSSYSDNGIGPYNGYIEKMASVVIELPKIEHYYLEKYLFQQINGILKFFKKHPIEETDFRWYISTKRFKNIRDIKRFCNAFYASYLQVKNEVNVFNYINITILFLFYHDLYNEAWQNQSIWFFKGESNRSKEYFDRLKKQYSNMSIEDELLYLISPNYTVFGINKLRNEKQKSYFIDNRYLNLYFTHNFSENRIPDEILDSMIDSLAKEEDDKKREFLINQFLYEYKDKILDIFMYLNINFLEDYIFLYKQIIILFADKSFELIEKRPVEEIVNCIKDMVSKFDDKNDINGIDFFTKIIERSTLITLTITIYMRVYAAYRLSAKMLPIDVIEKIIDKKIVTDFNKALNNFSNYEYKRYLYFWLRESYVKEAKKITDLSSEEYGKLRQKVKLIGEHLKNNFDYFWIFIGEDLLNYLSDSDEIGGIIFQNIVYFMDLWGKEYILDIIKKLLKKDLIQQNRQDILKLYDLIEKIPPEISKTLENNRVELLNKLVFLDLYAILNSKKIDKNSNDDYYLCNINKKEYIIKIEHIRNINNFKIEQIIQNIKYKKNPQQIDIDIRFDIKTIFYLYFVAYDEIIAKEIINKIKNINDNKIEFRLRTRSDLEKEF